MSDISIDRLQYLITWRIAQVLVLWAYTTPAVGVIEAVTEKYQEIEWLPEFAILSENIQQIKLILQELFDRRKEYLPALIEKVAQEIEVVTKKFGLSFTDYPNGSTYIHIHDD